MARFTLFAGGVVLLTPFSGWAAAPPRTTIALTGELAPGAGGAVYRNFGRPQLNNQGLVAFDARFSDRPELLGEGVFSGRPGSLNLLVRRGDAAPGLPDGTMLGNPEADRSMSVADLNNAGQILLSSNLVGSALQRGLNGWFIGDGAVLRLVTHEQAPAPGVEGAIFGYAGSMSLNDAGEVAFIGYVWGVPDATSVGIWKGAPGGLQLVARLGQAAEGLPGLVYSAASPTETDASFFRLTLANNGQVVFHGFASTPDYQDNAWASWGGTPGSLRVLTHEGDAAPGAGPGVVFTHSGDPSINPAGIVASTPGLSAPGQVGEAWGLYVGTPENMRLVLRSGDAAPGLGDGSTLTFFREQQANSRGQVAFKADVVGAGMPRRESLWVAGGDDLRLVAMIGQPVPGFEEMVFEGFGDVQMNDLGQIAFIAYSDGKPSLWATDLAGNFTRVHTAGSLFDVGGGDWRRIDQLIYGDFELNDRGELAYSLRFDDGSAGIFLTSVPEPLGAVWLAATLSLLGRMRRRI